MRDFKKLEIWEIARRFNKSVYELTSRFPKEETYNLTSQMRRSSVGICSNIAEGCGRRTNEDFCISLYKALSSVKELLNQLALIEDLNYADKSEVENLFREINNYSFRLMNFIKYIEKKN